MNDYYDIVIVKKQNKIKSNNETDFNERLKGIGFSLLNISDELNFSCNIKKE